MGVFLLCESRFTQEDRGNPIFLHLRRLHPRLDRPPGGRSDVRFVVSKHIPAIQRIYNKAFGTIQEAKAYWNKQAILLEDQGLERYDFPIHGFHEEG